mgnify:FL=1
MHNKTFHTLKYLVAAYLLATVVLPLVVLFAAMDPAALRAVFYSPQFLPMLDNSLFSSIWATGISIALSFSLALALNRSRIE